MPNINLLFKEATSQTSLTDSYQVDDSDQLIKIDLIIGDTAYFSETAPLVSDQTDHLTGCRAW